MHAGPPGSSTISPGGAAGTAAERRRSGSAACAGVHSGNPIPSQRGPRGGISIARPSMHLVRLDLKDFQISPIIRRPRPSRFAVESWAFSGLIA